MKRARVKLLEDVPVEAKHGLTKGREFEVLPSSKTPGNDFSNVWVMGDAGEPVKLHDREFRALGRA